MRELEDQENLARTVFRVAVPVEIPGDYLAISGARQNLVREDFARVSHSDYTQVFSRPRSKDSLPWPQTTSVEELSIFKPLPSQKLRDASTLGPGEAPLIASPSSGAITFKIRSASGGAQGFHHSINGQRYASGNSHSRPETTHLSPSSDFATAPPPLVVARGKRAFLNGPP